MFHNQKRETCYDPLRNRRRCRFRPYVTGEGMIRYKHVEGEPRRLHLVNVNVPCFPSLKSSTERAAGISISAIRVGRSFAIPQTLGSFIPSERHRGAPIHGPCYRSIYTYSTFRRVIRKLPRETVGQRFCTVAASYVADRPTILAKIVREFRECGWPLSLPAWQR